MNKQEYIEKENQIRKEVGNKVMNSALSLLEKHDTSNKILIDNEEAGKYDSYTKPVAQALIHRKRAKMPKRFFFFGKMT